MTYIRLEGSFFFLIVQTATSVLFVFKTANTGTWRVNTHYVLGLMRLRDPESNSGPPVVK